MRKSKILIIFLCMILFLSSQHFPYAYAFERKDHDKYMVEVLFKNFLETENKQSIQDEIEALESASYLAIDQFNGNGQKDLDNLATYGVKGLPTLNDIDYSASGKTHRSYTHRGWDFVYGGMASDRWILRKQILLNTADAIFDFQGNEKQKDSFCATIYYIHVLGDLLDDESYTIQNGLIMDLGGRIYKADIIDELLKHFKILFSDQKYTHKYLFLTTAMERYNTKLSKIVRSKGGINSDEKFVLRQEYVKGLMRLLTMYLPEMLKEEQFFYDVFYK